MEEYNKNKPDLPDTDSDEDEKPKSKSKPSKSKSSPKKKVLCYMLLTILYLHKILLLRKVC